MKFATIVKLVKRGELLLDVFQVRKFRKPSLDGRVGAAERYLAFAIDQKGAVHRIDMGDAEEIDSKVDRWVAELTGSSPLDNARVLSLGREVARHVQGPILEFCVGVQRLRIRSDGALHRLPWCALPGVTDHQYWIEDLRIEQFRTLRSKENHLANLPNPSLLAVGGIDFGRLEQIYEMLPGTEKEKQIVTEQFQRRYGKQNIVALSGKSATEQRLIDELPKSQYIHLATHGFFEARDESNVFQITGATALLQSALVLADQEDPNLVGTGHQFLTADEIQRVDLSDVRLVVLSACDSGLGKVRSGQGVQGILDSFHVAGAPRVVGTLWKVSDRGTPKLVNDFYWQLWNAQQPPAEALRQAQLASIKAAANMKDTITLDSPGHPAVWAAFFISNR